MKKGISPSTLGLSAPKIGIISFHFIPGLDVGPFEVVATEEVGLIEVDASSEIVNHAMKWYLTDKKYNRMILLGLRKN